MFNTGGVRKDAVGSVWESTNKQDVDSSYFEKTNKQNNNNKKIKECMKLRSRLLE